MSRELTRRRVLAGSATALLASTAGCSGATPFVGKRTEATRTIPRDGAARLTVRNDVGDVTLRATDRDDLHVRIVEQSSSVASDLADLEFRVERPDGDLRLRSVWTGGDGLLGGRPSMDLDVILPRDLPVSAVESRVGDVTLVDTEGDVDAETDVGDVDVRNVDGTVRASTETGDVTVTAPRTLGDVRSETGDVTVEVAALDGDTTIRTETGDVDAAVAADLDATLTARTETGDVSVSGVTLSEATRDEHVVVGTLGAGGPALDVRAETGDVSITALE